MPGNIDIWGKSLLDLGKRNNLINFKESWKGNSKLDKIYKGLVSILNRTHIVQG